jgi:hypothetical protein
MSQIHVITPNPHEVYLRYKGMEIVSKFVKAFCQCAHCRQALRSLGIAEPVVCREYEAMVLSCGARLLSIGFARCRCGVVDVASTEADAYGHIISLRHSLVFLNQGIHADFS